MCELLWRSGCPIWGSAAGAARSASPPPRATACAVGSRGVSLMSSRHDSSGLDWEQIRSRPRTATQQEPPEANQRRGAELTGVRPRLNRRQHPGLPVGHSAGEVVAQALRHTSIPSDERTYPRVSDADDVAAAPRISVGPPELAPPPLWGGSCPPVRKLRSSATF